MGDCVGLGAPKDPFPIYISKLKVIKDFADYNRWDLKKGLDLKRRLLSQHFVLYTRPDDTQS